jgi:hypothetical protein
MIQGEVKKALMQVNFATREDLVTKDEIREIVREQIQQAIREKGIFKNEGTK